ncbi:MAG: bifunctional histidinol-phosphatase/imidazoleglycerol-phosphate dehydratase HisB [Candidatus Kapaibacterium sp.]|nr:MAG: bifunctional histidinol-phosphatase/imidazoleglycerol-phosphate dehydratase HisB [Candidatus Kapabacteria bacterium]
MKKALFIDRDGTIILEPPDEQIDSLEKLEFVPRAITVLAQIAEEFDYELVMATNQDGLGTSSFPEDTFHPAQNKMVSVLQGEGVVFNDILIDRSFPHENTTTRKPGTGMFGKYMEKGAYNLAESFVIGDRITDAKLARNLGSQAIILHSKHTNSLTDDDRRTLPIALETQDWREVYAFLLTRQAPMRLAEVHRTTNETDILVKLNLDGTGKARIHTGLGFFDHLLDQLVRHSGIDLELTAHGDLHIDEHHTIEDTALALGEAFTKALGDKRGITRYGYYLLPMDEALAEASVEFVEQVSEHSSEQFSEIRTHAAIDFSGRNWLVWKADFKREKIGDTPTEMFHHFFKSFTDTAKCTLNLHSVADNEHHKIEALFKAFARAVKVAIRRDARNNAIPSTKGVL